MGPEREETDAVEAQARALVEALADAGWRAEAVDTIVESALRQAAGANTEGVMASLRFACTEVVPRLAKTSGEIDAVLHALDGGYVPAGPSGSPLRGLVNVLPTGRNFYSVDPKAIPSRLAWQTGQAMADSLLARYLADTGDYPRSVGLSVWGTSAMRTSGDDIAEVLALIGVLPVWDEMSRRVVDLEVVPLEELQRPRIDVTVGSRASSATPSRTWWPCWTTPSAWWPISTNRLRRTTYVPTPLPTWPNTVITAARRPGSSGRSRARTEPASCR